jgi:hypothetical protein
MDGKIPAVNKTKIVKVEEEEETVVNGKDDADFYEEMYHQEKVSEYDEMTVTMIQKTILEYVERKSLTICEYLSTDDIKEFLGYR